MKMHAGGCVVSFLLNVCCLLFLICGVSCKYKDAELSCGVAFKPPPYAQMWYGKDLSPYEHPWLCDFIFEHDGFGTHCFAILISEHSIIADASCFTPAELIHTKIKNLTCGAVKNRINITALDVTIETRSRNFGLATIKIKKVTFSTVIRPICLFKYKEISVGDPVIVLGNSAFFGDESQKAEIFTRTCQKLYDNITNKEIICASKIFTWITPADKGAPLLTFYKNRYYLVGILSGGLEFSEAIFQHRYPIRFIRISPFCKTLINVYTDVSCHNNAVPLSKEDSCGIVASKRIKRAISLGEDIDNLQPWYCRIYKKDYDSCGGTLISFKHALIAAHCVDDGIEKSDLKIYCGINLQTISNVENIIIFEKFIHEFLENDIAILVFEKEIEFDGNVGPACLTTDNDYFENQTFIAVGSDGNTWMTTKSIKLKLANQIECEVNFHMLTNPLTSMCMKSNDSLTQKGDSGGPLLALINKKWHVVGVLSGGITDQETNYFHFTRVSSFYDFITTNTDSHVQWTNNEKESFFSYYYKLSAYAFILFSVIYATYKFSLHTRIYDFCEEKFFYLWNIISPRLGRVRLS